MDEKRKIGILVCINLSFPMEEKSVDPEYFILFLCTRRFTYPALFEHSCEDGP